MRRPLMSPNAIRMSESRPLSSVSLCVLDREIRSEARMVDGGGGWLGVVVVEKEREEEEHCIL